MTKRCKIRITKDIAGIYPQYRPKLGKTYRAEYIEYETANRKTIAICIVDMLGKRIIVRSDEFEILEV